MQCAGSRRSSGQGSPSAARVCTGRLRLLVETLPGFVGDDLLNCLESVAGQAPSEATLVVFHTAVLAYLDPEQRTEFANRFQRLDAHWFSNEGPGVTPGPSNNLSGSPG